MKKIFQRVWDFSPHAAELLLELMRSNRKYVVVSFGAAFLSALLEGTTLALLTLAIDALGSGELSAAGQVAAGIASSLGFEREELFIALVLAAVISQVLHSGLAFISDVANAMLQAKVEQVVRIRIFDRFMDFEFGEARRHGVGELSSHLDQVSLLGMTINRMHETVTQVLLVMVYMVLLFWLSWQATLISVAAMLVLSLLMRGLVRKVRSAAQAYKTSVVSVTRQAVEYLNGLRVIKTFGREDHAREQMRVFIDDSSQARRRGFIWQATISPLIQAVSVCVVGTILAVGYARYGQSDRAKLGELTAFLVVVFRSAPRISALNKMRGLLAQYTPFFERISELLRKPPSTRHRGSRTFKRLEREIEFSNVSFQYPNTDGNAVQDLNFSLRRGTMTALVGESGAGKTTIADLLLRLYDVSSGDILVDGVALRQLDWNDWRDNLGVVSQETFLLSGSIRSNLAYGKLDATDAEIEAAARAAGAHDFIMQLDAGYDTLLGEQGFRLSGGQRQRLSIARAFLRDPQVLILDEATSDLDSESEALIQESIGRLRANRTVLVIAHRLSTIASADEILVMRNGQIAERGAHQALLAHNGTYARYVTLQNTREA